jgi:hypothetical protein
MDDAGKTLGGFGTPCGETDKLLFAASTETRIGDGQKISF